MTSDIYLSEAGYNGSIDDLNNYNLSANGGFQDWYMPSVDDGMLIIDFVVQQLSPGSFNENFWTSDDNGPMQYIINHSGQGSPSVSDLSRTDNATLIVYRKVIVE